MSAILNLAKKNSTITHLAKYLLVIIIDKTQFFSLLHTPNVTLNTDLSDSESCLPNTKASARPPRARADSNFKGSDIQGNV